MTNIKIAEKLGVQHQKMQLIGCNNSKLWKTSNNCNSMKVEMAVLQFFHRDGWTGYSSEGGLILNVIKAASFKPLQQRNRTTYIEALYAQNVAFDEDKHESDDLIKNIRTSDFTQFKNNIEIMFDTSERIDIYGIGTSSIKSISSSSIRNFFPDLEPKIMKDFYLHIGNERLARMAEIFAKNPYEYRKGWPDLTLWKPNTEQIIFREVKAPGDKIRPSQKKIIQDILLPLGYDVGIIDVIPYS